MNVRNFLVGMLAIALGGGAAMAQGTPSSKATAAVNTLVRCHMTTAQADDDTALPASCEDLWTGDAVSVGNDGFIEIMSADVKLSNSQSLFVSPSLVTGLYTRTKTKGRTDNTTSTAEAMGGVYLRAVLVDSQGNEIEPAPLNMCDPAILGCVVNLTDNESAILLDSRIQTLSQTLSDCVIDVVDFGDDDDGTCDFESTIDLILKTTSAHTFNFIFANVGQGVYTLKIKAAVASEARIIEGSGTAVGSAAFGVGSVLAESVRLVHGFEF